MKVLLIFSLIILKCPTFAQLTVDTVMASSALKKQGAISFNTTNAHDFSYKTAWAEGVEGVGVASI